MAKEQIGPVSAIKLLQEQIAGEQSRTFKDFYKIAQETAAQAVAGVQWGGVKSVSEHINAIEHQLLGGIKIPCATEHFTEIMRQAAGPLSENSRFGAAEAIAQIAKSISTDRASYTTAAEAITKSITQDIDFTRIAGSGISTVFAALQSEEAKGYASLRGSFAGIAAATLRQALEGLDERDEQAFNQLEQLIDEKIATLPHNQVTAESLWRFLIMLFIALGGLGTGFYQIKDAKQSSAIQAEQQVQIMKVLEHIAFNTGQLIPKPDQNIYYVVERQVNLKLKPNNRSATIVIIYPNQKVRLVQMNHQWIYIEYFDYLEGVPKYGWANKKYLKRVDK
ncbi:MAG TPA: hypothetical protein VFQ47_05085 [Nitrososphaera sp.]|nr:hypothetical protein [Nitrososphaera sp.]